MCWPSSLMLTKIELDSDRLLALTTEEYAFILAFGHHANEINAVTKLLYWAGDGDEKDSPQAHGRQTMLTFLLRLLAGKLFEGWRLLEKTFLARPIAATYVRMLSDDTSQYLDDLKRYFGRKNAAEVIRNRFGFHYSADDLADNLQHTSDPLLLYMDGQSAPNTLFHFSETVMLESLARALRDEGIEKSLVELNSEFFELAVGFSQTADGIMEAMIIRADSEIRKAPPENIRISRPPRFERVSIPWFVNIGSAMRRGQDSA